jgi:hypothetical protein
VSEHVPADSPSLLRTGFLIEAEMDSAIDPRSVDIAFESIRAAVSHVYGDSSKVREHAVAAGRTARDQELGLMLAWSSAFEGWMPVAEGKQDRIANAIAQARAMGSDQFLPQLIVFSPKHI